MPARGQVRFGRWGKVPWQPWQALIAVLMVSSGITDIVAPDAIASGALPRWVSLMIACTYLAGGVAILLGMWRAWLRIEMVGLMLLLLGIAGATTAAIFYDSPRKAAIIVTFLAVVWAAGLQLSQLFRGRVILQIEVADDPR